MTAFPRVEIPGADPEQVEALREQLAEAEARENHLAKQQAGMVLTMLRRGTVPGQHTTPDRKSRASRKARKQHRRNR